MPSKSPAQAHLMAGLAPGWHPSHMANPPPMGVAQEFNQADKGGAMLGAPQMAAPHVAVMRAQAAVLRGHGHAGHPFGARGRKMGP